MKIGVFYISKINWFDKRYLILFTIAAKASE